MTAPVLSVPTSNGRYYRDPQGNRAMVPSITNIIGTLDKPALKFWAAKEAASYAAANRAKLATLEEQEVFQLVKGAPFQRSDDSPAAIGDIVHGWIERHVDGNPPTHDELMQSHRTARDMYQSFIGFKNYYKPEFVSAEFTVWSDKYDYAGTADLHLRIAGHEVLVDTKTGKNVYAETAMQLAAIANADVVLGPDGQEAAVPAFTKFAVLHLRPRSATLVPIENIPAAFECFVALRRAFDWKVNYADRTIGFAPQVKSTSNQEG